MPRKVNQKSLIDEVRKKGVTARKARKAVQTVIKAWKDAIAHWEEVETPCGTIRVVPTNGAARVEHCYLTDANTKEKRLYFVRYPGRRRVVKLKPNPRLDLEPPPYAGRVTLAERTFGPPAIGPRIPPPSSTRPAPPPPPITPAEPDETSEERECRELVRNLLPAYIPITPSVMAQLQSAVGAHPRDPETRITFTPGAFLRRLRQFRARQFHFSSVAELAQQVSEFYWI